MVVMVVIRNAKSLVAKRFCGMAVRAAGCHASSEVAMVVIPVEGFIRAGRDPLNGFADQVRFT